MKMVIILMMTVGITICVASAVANIYVVNWCIDHGKQPHTPFWFTECR